MRQGVKYATLNWGCPRITKIAGEYRKLSPQEAVYYEEMGRLPPLPFPEGSEGHAQWTYRKDKRKPGAEELCRV